MLLYKLLALIHEKGEGYPQISIFILIMMNGCKMSASVPGQEKEKAAD